MPEEVMKILFNQYCEKYTIPQKLELNISIVEDVSIASSKFLEKYNRKIILDGIDYNGTTCIPKMIDEPIAIFISKQIVDNYLTNNCQFVCTFFHELTHAIDFYNYCEKYCDGSYDELLKKTSSYGFKMWTEFNAKKISYLLYCKFINGDSYNSEDALKMILNRELPFQNQELIKEMFNISIDDAVYKVILYLGRYYVWELLFEKDFKNGINFPKILNEQVNPELLNLYNKLKENIDTENYYCDLNECINLFESKLSSIQII